MYLSWERRIFGNSKQQKKVYSRVRLDGRTHIVTIHVVQTQGSCNNEYFQILSNVFCVIKRNVLLQRRLFFYLH